VAFNLKHCSIPGNPDPILVVPASALLDPWSDSYPQGSEQALKFQTFLKNRKKEDVEEKKETSDQHADHKAAAAFLIGRISLSAAVAAAASFLCVRVSLSPSFATVGASRVLGALNEDKDEDAHTVRAKTIKVGNYISDVMHERCSSRQFVFHQHFEFTCISKQFKV
jgi:hypothetical protein